MFDVSFIELVVIAVVALVVLGPDKLPDAIRTSALWIGRAKRSFNKAKAEIEQQLNADEIRRQLHNESILADIEEARRKADELIKDTQQDLQDSRDEIQAAVDSARDIPAVTSSAEEGLPSGPAGQLNPQTPTAEPAPALQEQPAAAPAPAGAGEDASSGSDVPAQPPQAQEAANAVINADESSEKPDAAQPPGENATDAKEELSTNAPQPLQDFYNSPPEGRVRLEGGKYYAVDETPSEATPDGKSVKPDSQVTRPSGKP